MRLLTSDYAVKAKLVKRYKRFFMDCTLENGSIVTAHLANTGSMKTFLNEGCDVYLVYDPAPHRKLDYRVISVRAPSGVLVGVNTMVTNALIDEALTHKRLEPFQDVTHWTREATFVKGTRFDFQLFFKDSPPCFLEVKNVQMSRTAGMAEFPDAVTTRGAKHWRELMVAKEQGYRAALCFCVQRSDVQIFCLAEDIDPVYAQAAREAIAAGVEVYAYACAVMPESITVTTPLKIRFF